VSGKVVLWLKAEVREVAAARCQSGEGESWRGGERTRLAAMRFPFKGGAAGWQWRGGGLGERGHRVEEAGESRGGWVRSRATVEGGGVGATWDGAVDRWAEMRWGPVIDGWVRGEATRRDGSARH
jgi:hypothetical protein